MAKSKDERLELVKKYMIDSKGKISRKEILKEIQSEGHDVDISTISRDLQELGYVKGKDGHYFIKDSIIIERNKEALSNIFANDPPIIYGPYQMPYVSQKKEELVKGDSSVQTDIQKTKIRVMILQVEEGLEPVTGKLIYSIYKESVRGVIPGIGCNMILTKDIRCYKKVSQDLKNLGANGAGNKQGTSEAVEKNNNPGKQNVVN